MMDDSNVEYPADPSFPSDSDRFGVSIMRQILEWHSPRPGQTLLYAECGAGRMTALFAETDGLEGKVVALDPGLVEPDHIRRTVCPNLYI